MVNANKIVKCFKDHKFGAEIIDDDNGEIQIEVSTKAANYIVSIICYEDSIDLSSCVRSFNSRDLMDCIGSYCSDDDLLYWADSMDVNSSTEEIVDEIINGIDDKTTVSLVKDLNRFVSHVEKLVNTYKENDVDIGDLLHYITSNYT